MLGDRLLGNEADCQAPRACIPLLSAILLVHPWLVPAARIGELCSRNGVFLIRNGCNIGSIDE